MSNEIVSPSNNTRNQTKPTRSSALSATRIALAMTYRVAPGLAEGWIERQFLHAKRYAWPEVENEWLDQAEKFTLTTQGLPNPAWDGQPLQAYRWGIARVGRVAVMHGWSGRTTQFHRFIARFVDAGYEVVGIDAPGHGASVGKMSSVLHFHNALERLVQHVGPVDAVIGHSMGGGVSLYAMSLGLPARKAVLIAPNGDLVSHSRMIAHHLGLNEQQRLSLQSRIERRFGVSWEAVSGTHVAPLLKQCGLVIHCKDDREIPFTMGESIANAWRHAQLVPTSGLGHKRILTSEAVVESSLAFVKE